MPDDNILCPACTRKLRMRESDFGQMIQCPLCAAVFRAPPGAAPAQPLPPAPAASAPLPAPTPAPPAAAPAPPPVVDTSITRSTPREPVLLEPHNPIDVQRAVLLPGITLLICGVLNLLYPVVLLGELSRDGPAKIARMQEEGTPDFLKPMLKYQEMDDTQIIVSTFLASGFAFAVSVGMLLGGVNMLRLNNYWLAVVGCVFAFMPSPMCLFSAPLGVWSLFVLRIPEVREAFGAPTEVDEEGEGEEAKSDQD